MIGEALTFQSDWGWPPEGELRLPSHRKVRPRSGSHTWRSRVASRVCQQNYSITRSQAGIQWREPPRHGRLDRFIKAIKNPHLGYRGRNSDVRKRSTSLDINPVVMLVI